MLEEWTVDGSNGTLVTYTIGDDVISQQESDWIWNTNHWVEDIVDDTQYLIYDGHGSTRQLVSGSVGSTNIIDDFSYDGYGVLLQDENTFQPVAQGGLGVTPGVTQQQATNLLYAGEQFDTDLQQYYLRARFYDPLNGRFNRTDPFAGTPHDPQSLHKYLYCHANPVNNLDPSGMMLGSFGFSLGEVLFVSAIMATLSGMVTYNYTGSVKAAVIVGASAFVFSFVALGGVGLTMAAITGGGAVTSPYLLNPNSWQEAESMLGRMLDLSKNAERFFVNGMTTYRIPDFVDKARLIADSKFVQTLNSTPQLKDFATLAKVLDVPLYIYVRVGTHVSVPAVELVESTGGGVIKIFK